MAKVRPLVGGFLERISVKAFEKYHREITKLVKTEHGVYALYKNDRLYYVGLAVDLRRRIKQHLGDKHAQRWNRFSLYLVRKVDHIKEIESLLLRISDPTGNKQSGRLRQATNLKAKLRGMMEQRQRAELDDILDPVRGARRRRTADTHRRTKKKKKVKARSHGQRSLQGIVGRGKRIYATYKGKTYKAVVCSNGRIKYNGKLYASPSAAGVSVKKGKATNGWVFWRIRKGGHWVFLDDLRRSS